MAEIVQLDIKQGETFQRTLTLVDDTRTEPLDITNYTFRAAVRESYTSGAPVLEPTVTKMLPYAAGTVLVSLTSAQTRALTLRKYVIDVEYTDDSVAPVTEPLLEGYLVVRHSAVR
jgi:hypothetical protein